MGTTRRIQVLRWHIRSDPAATRTAYSSTEDGIGCDCTTCRNFELVGSAVFPAEMHALLDALGITSTKPAEVYHEYTAPNGYQVYGGWFHFIGAIEKGEDSHVPVDVEGKSFLVSLEHLSERCRIGFTMRGSLGHGAFEKHLVGQLEFSTQVPWVLDEFPPE